MTRRAPAMPAAHRRIVGACCATHATQDGLTASIYVLLPVLAQSLSLGFAQVGLVRAAHAGAMWLLELPAGIGAERVGERGLLVFGLLTAGAGYLSLSVAGGFHGVLLALFIAGCGAAFQHSLCSSLLSRGVDGPAVRGALGLYNSSGDVGKLMFTAGVSAAIGAGVHWQSVTAGYGTIALVGGCALWIALRRARAGAAPARGDGVRDAGSRRDWGIRHRAGFTALAAIVLIDIAVQDGFLVFVAFAMLDKQVSPGLAAAAVTLVLLGGIAGKLGCGLLANRLGTVRALVLVEVLSAGGIAAVAMLDAPAALALLPFVGVVLQGSSTITYGAVSDLVHAHRRSRGFALIYTMSSSASMIGPIAFGLASDRVGVDGALIAMALAVLLTLPIAPLLGRGLRGVAASTPREA